MGGRTKIKSKGNNGIRRRIRKTIKIRKRRRNPSHPRKAEKATLTNSYLKKMKNWESLAKPNPINIRKRGILKQRVIYLRIRENLRRVSGLTQLIPLQKLLPSRLTQLYQTRMLSYQHRIIRRSLKMKIQKLQIKAKVIRRTRKGRSKTRTPTKLSSRPGQFTGKSPSHSRSESDQQDSKGEPKRSNSKENLHSGSMWETDLIDSVFSPNVPKKSGKNKRKTKDSKPGKPQQTPDKKTSPKSKAEKNFDRKSDKKSNQVHKEKPTSDQKSKKISKKHESEETKSNTNSVTLKQHNSVPVKRSGGRDQQKQVSDFTRDHPKQDQWSRKDHYKGKKYNKKEFKNDNIPQETVSSFYQCDEEHPDQKYFEGIDK